MCRTVHIPHVTQSLFLDHCEFSQGHLTIGITHGAGLCDSFSFLVLSKHCMGELAKTSVIHNKHIFCAVTCLVFLGGEWQ